MFNKRKQGIAKIYPKAVPKGGLNTMVIRLSIDNLEENVKAFLKGFKVNKEQYLLEADGKPLLGVVAPEKVESDEGLKILERLWAKNEDVDEEQLEKDIAEAIEYVRREKA